MPRAWSSIRSPACWRVAVRDPNRLLLVEGATGAPVREVGQPGHARHLQLAAPGGPVLVPAENSNSLVEVALPGGETTEIPVGDHPHDAAQVASGQILVGDERGGTPSVVTEVATLSTAADELTEVARFPTVRQPDTVAVDPTTGRVFVGSRATGELELIDVR
jgi:DNA-binding beta-propeller fold protein YncE